MRSAKKRSLANIDQIDDEGSDELDDLFEDRAPVKPICREDEIGLHLIVERILGRKRICIKEGSAEDEELYFVKWRGLSYLHVSWERQEDVSGLLKLEFHHPKSEQFIFLPCFD